MLPLTLVARRSTRAEIFSFSSECTNFWNGTPENRENFYSSRFSRPVSKSSSTPPANSGTAEAVSTFKKSCSLTGLISTSTPVGVLMQSLSMGTSFVVDATHRRLRGHSIYPCRRAKKDVDSSGFDVIATEFPPEISTLSSALLIEPPPCVEMVRRRTSAETGEKHSHMDGDSDSGQSMALIGTHSAKVSITHLNSSTSATIDFRCFIVNAARHLRAVSISSGSCYTAAGTSGEKSCKHSPYRLLSSWPSERNRLRVFSKP